MKKIEINKKLYNVVNIDDYTSNLDLYNPSYTAIAVDEETVLPIKNKTDSGPGVYYDPNGMVCYLNKPLEDEVDMYSADKIIDFDNCKSINEIIDKQKMIRDIEEEIITNTDNILILKVSEKDTPEMRGIKEAINAKRIDAKQYETRFEQFQNDMRLLKGHSITLGKIVSICSALDISADLTLKDNGDNCPNPINNEIVVNLTTGRGVNND